MRYSTLIFILVAALFVFLYLFLGKSAGSKKDRERTHEEILDAIRKDEMLRLKVKDLLDEE